MRCEKVQERLPAYVDGCVGWMTRRRVRAHLDTCPGCRAEHRALERTVSLLHQVPGERVPRDVAAAVMARIPERPACIQRPHALRTALLVPAALAAAVAIQVWSRDARPPVAVSRGPQPAYVREYAHFRASQ